MFSCCGFRKTEEAEVVERQSSRSSKSVSSSSSSKGTRIGNKEIIVEDKAEKVTETRKTEKIDTTIDTKIEKTKTTTEIKTKTSKEATDSLPNGRCKIGISETRATKQHSIFCRLLD